MDTTTGDVTRTETHQLVSGSVTHPRPPHQGGAYKNSCPLHLQKKKVPTTPPPPCCFPVE